ncbi:hypothetical protein AB0N62_26050 [Streptomyces sp. NPDC093982]|uniref:hypothetical protein n=1 Tax=Streptomyces sp. NPDC093982 TaxID=3155077 RepID=UPI003420500B
MSELTPLDKAEAAAREAAANTDVARIVAAVLATQQAVQQTPASAPQCQHDHHKPRRSAGEWVGIACAVCVGGVGIAFASIALAILGGVAAIVVLVLRDMWRDYQKGK